MIDQSKRERTERILKNYMNHRRNTAMGKFYIDGKKYDTKKSDLLCSFNRTLDLWSPDIEELYRTKKGTYFKIANHKGVVNVSVLDEKKALAFMDTHAAGIVTDTYDRLFGAPEEG